MATTNGATLADLTAPLNPTQRKAMVGRPQGNPFSRDDRLYRSYTDANTLFEYGELDLYAMREMLSKDGNPRKLEQVLTLPIRGAGWEIRGTGPAADLVRENLGPLLDDVIARATSAFAYRKAFFEITWKLDGERVLFNEILPRPAMTCEAAFDERTGNPGGFRQQLAPVSVYTMSAAEMGWVRIPANRAFIYTYGTHREPVHGVSDLDVCLYCWEQVRKLQFLWCQYLEGQSLPKLGAFGPTLTEAEDNATAVAKAQASGVIPMVWPDDPARKMVEVIESSGKGADQFEVAVRYFEGKQTQSVLASFTDLAQHAAGGRGSNALSADQSEFFLASEQGKADEIARQITSGLSKPLVVYNFGPDEPLPELYIGPIGNRQVDRALDLLKAIMAAQHPTAPPKFTASLMSHVASFLGLEQEDVATVAQEWAERQAEEATYQQQLAETMRLQQQALTLPGARPAPAVPAPRAGQQLSAGEQLTLDLAATEDPGEDAGGEPEHTGGMIALLPDAASAKKLVATGDKAEAPEALHLTLAYLGDNVTGMDADVADEIPAAVRTALAEAGISGPIDARVFAHTTFNADGGPDGDRDPCAVYGIGESDLVAPLNRKVVSALGDVDGLVLPAQHEPFVPHVTAGYGMTAGDLSYLGPVRFDRVVVALGDKRTEIPLGE